ncbi:MAG: ribulose-phosphate 3-epimerase [Clostridiales bacterium]|nr:ribulose-phosphate 3-epimerase [Clostridiales bacterium]
MNRDIWVAPSVLSANFTRMEQEVRSIQTAGADLAHLDVMDGVFVPNITFGIKMVADIRKITDMPLDAHLMIVHPERYVEQFAKAGADYITVHYEACEENLIPTLQKIKACGVKAGAVINPDTPVEKIANAIECCDMVLLMSVFPGFGGQSFIESVLPKVEETKKLIMQTGKDIRLEIDGGITPANAGRVISAGADVLVAGSAVFGAPDRIEAIRLIRNAK